MRTVPMVCTSASGESDGSRYDEPSKVPEERMKMNADDDRARQLDRVLELVRKRIGVGQRGSVERFVGGYFGQVDPEDLAERLTPRTKLVILNSPANPTGGIVDRELNVEIARIRQMFRDADHLVPIIAQPTGQPAPGKTSRSRQQHLLRAKSQIRCSECRPRRVGMEGATDSGRRQRAAALE